MYGNTDCKSTAANSQMPSRMIRGEIRRTVGWYHVHSFLLGLLVMVLVAGCSKESNLILHVSPRANGGKPIYMMLRAVNEATFNTDSYQAVAAKVAVPDETVLGTEVLHPNTTRTITLNPPAKKQIAIYFFFTSPTGDWKLLLDDPPPKSTSVVVRDRRIVLP